MKTLLFLDDWFLDGRVDVERHFAVAVPAQIPQAHRLPRISVIRDEDRKCFIGLGKELKQGNSPGTSHLIYASSDGIHWQKKKGHPKFHFAGSPGKRVQTPVLFPFEQGWFYDKWDTNSSRRYKMLIWPYPDGMNGGPGLVACSPDGSDWIIKPRYRWFTHAYGSDTNNNMFYNPFSGKWAVICRRRNNDRRIAIVESDDMEHWSEPKIILHPDAMDAPFMQFYGMAGALYEDEYFIGALQCYRVPVQETNVWSKGRVKMWGTIDAQLTYSYNGETWLRGDRTPLIERGESGTFGHSCIYPFFIGASPEKKIHIYSLGTKGSHGVTIARNNETLLLHTLRYDGFAYLESVGRGQVTTKVLIPQSGDISVNYQAPFGQVLVQVSDGERRAIPGYSFEDCVPLCGDEITEGVRWKKHADISRLKGKPVRIEFRLLDARLYALRLHCSMWYGYWPGTDVERA